MGGLLGLATGLGLAAANGANDTFKGVATLYGSGMAGYRRALAWAVLCTAAGSGAALFLGHALLKAFSGRGLVPDAVLADPRFPLAVAFGAAASVGLATRLGLPISTTHALIGALVGAGLCAAPGGVHGTHLGAQFLAPLLLSPLVAMGLAGGLHPLLHRARERLGIDQETCICVGSEVRAVVPGGYTSVQALANAALPSVCIEDTAYCRVRYRGRLAGVRVGALLDAGHFASAGLVSFARGLNDTPKIAALLLAAGTLAPGSALVAVGIAMGAGALLGARRVAETLSRRVTSMNAGQGALANGVTGLLVIGASHLGMPVSTTHVSGGALFGIGASTREGRWRTIVQIVAAWLVTLPASAALAAGAWEFLGLF